MSNMITLTRAQWSDLHSGLEQIRDTLDTLYDSAAAMTVLGLNRPAGTIAAVQDEIIATTGRLHAILVDADDADRPATGLGALVERFRRGRRSSAWEA